MNNGEYIRYIFNDELAVFLESLRGCPPPLYDYACPEGDENLTYRQCINCWKEWLNSPFKTNKDWKG